jgi:hypothetical protein
MRRYYKIFGAGFVAKEVHLLTSCSAFVKLPLLKQGANVL